jgi:hypothetical protein
MISQMIQLIEGSCQLALYQTFPAVDMTPNTDNRTSPIRKWLASFDPLVILEQK